MSRRGTFAKGLVAGLLMASLGGCSGTDPDLPKLAKVSGKVTYNGKPVTKGSVIFTPVAGDKGDASGQVATGQIGADGSYELTTFNTGDGAVIGQHTVTIEAPSEDINKLNQPKEDGTIAYILPKPAVPEKYTKPSSSPLKQTVVEGANVFNLELSDK